jgi:DNA repair exonuclease SbcCD ATPase subunit
MSRSSSSEDQDSSMSNSSNDKQEMQTTPTKENFHDEESDLGASPALQATRGGSLSNTAPGGGAATGQTMTIEHKNTSPTRICGMHPLVLVGVLILIGVLAYFLSQWLSIPGLDKQIERLEKEVDRLSSEVTRLEEQNDRFEVLNGQLNNTVKELHNITDQLNVTANRLDDINQELNVTNQEFLQRIDELTAQNDEFARLNTDLNATAIELDAQVDRFQMAIATLILENSNLSNYTDALANITESLEDITQDQNATIQALKVALEGWVQENEKLGNLNDDLNTVVSFLNETSIGIGDSLETFTGFLAEQITSNRVLVLETLESTARQKTSNWDCDYRDIYREKDYGIDFEVFIPTADIPQVVSYVDARILTDLCLSEADFTKYLEDTYPLFLTSNRLVTAVTVYVTEASDWYFNEGVSPEQWAEAGYQCENIQDQFIFTGVTVII